MKLEFRTKPHQHQLEALKRCKGKTNFAFFMEMGTGKTKVAIDDMCRLWYQTRINSALIIAPKGVYLNWYEEELEKHMPDLWPRAELMYWTGNENTHPMKYLIASSHPHRAFRVMLVNVEALSKKKRCRAKEWCKKFIQVNGPTIIIVDESTKIKNMRAERTQNVIELGEHAMTHYRRILSGNPAPNGLLDMYSQCFFLDPQLLGHSSYYGFRNRYCVLKKVPRAIGQGTRGREFSMVVGYRDVGHLREKVQKFSYRVTKDECLDLPPRIYQTRHVDLTIEQIRIYDEIRESAVAILKHEEELKILTTKSVLSQILRLQQVVLGYFRADDTGELIHIKHNRIQALLDIVEETQDKVIVWCRFLEDIKTVRAALAKEYGTDSVVTYHGATKRDERPAVIKAFNSERASPRFFVGNAQTGGMGINLTRSHTTIYYSNSHNFEHRDQSEARTHRIGQGAGSVVYVDLITPGTVDEKIIAALKAKMNLSRELMGDAWRQWI